MDLFNPLCRLFFWMLCLALSCQVVVSGPAHADPANNRTVMVSAEEAKKHIRNHLQYIDQKGGEMSARYDFGSEKSEKTLDLAFRQAGIEHALQYVNAWGGWLYTFYDQLLPFYSYHREQLQESLGAIRGPVKKSDLDYLDQGMEAWKKVEKDAQAVMQAEVSRYIRRARLHDESVRLGKTIERAQGPFRKQLETRLEQLEKQETAAIEAMNKTNGAQAQEIRKTRLFSAIHAPQRIEPPHSITKRILFD